LATGASLNLSADEERFDKWLGNTIQGIIHQYESARLSDQFLPAVYFPKARARIENTTLYRVLQKLPKGGAFMPPVKRRMMG